MTRMEFEEAARDQNRRADERVALARTSHAPCDVVAMFAFGGETYCRAHRVMGPCPYGEVRA